MAVLDLAVVVLQQVGAVAVQHAGRAGGQRGAVFLALKPLAAGFHADDLHVLVVEERMEQADRVGAAADCRRPPCRAAGLRLPSTALRFLAPITDWKSRTISG